MVLDRLHLHTPSLGLQLHKINAKNSEATKLPLHSIFTAHHSGASRLDV